MLVSSLWLFSCNRDEEDPQPAIVGTWQVNDLDITLDGQSIRDFFDQLSGGQLSPEELDQVEAAFNEAFEEEFNDETTLEFQADGTLQVDSPDDSEDGGGTWRLTDDNTLIINDGTETTEFTVETLNSNSLVMYIEEEEAIDDSGSEEVTIRLTLSFTRQ